MQFSFKALLATAIIQGFLPGAETVSITAARVPRGPGREQSAAPKPELPGFLAPDAMAKGPMPNVRRRRAELFLREYGARLGRMEANLPMGNAGGAVLVSDGYAGFLLLENREGRRVERNYAVDLPELESAVTLPLAPVALEPGARVLWPLNLPLTNTVTLGYATAMPLCQVDDEQGRTVFLAAMPGRLVEIGISADIGVVPVATNGRKPAGIQGGNTIFRDLEPGREPVLEVRVKGEETLRIVVLSDEDSLNLVKVRWLGQDRVVLWRGLVNQNEDQIDLYDEVGRRGNGRLLVFPNPREIMVSSKRLNGRRDGVFMAYELGGRQW